MFSSARLKCLHERRQLLLVQSEVQRAMWAVEFTHLQQRLQSLNRTVTIARSILPWLGAVVPLWRLWSSRHQASRSWIGKIADALPIARQIIAVWKLFRRHRNGSAPAAVDNEATTSETSSQTAA